MLRSKGSNSKLKPKVAVIGAGLAGLTTAYRLKQADMEVDVYEAKSRVGGRIHTALINNMDGGYSVAELGGQNITDGGEAKNIINLAKELKLEILEYSRVFSRLFYDGRLFQDYHEVIKSNIKLSEEEIKNKLDELAKTKRSMQEVLDDIFAHQPVLKQFFTVFLTAYEGASPDKLSAYHNITTLQYMMLGGVSAAHNITGANPKIAMSSIKGGNAMLPLKLASLLGRQLHLSKVLKSISYIEDNKLALSFKDGGLIICDKLVLAIPAPLYRNIKFKNNIISQEQIELIAKVEYGKNAKILIPIKYQKLSHKSLFTDKMVTFLNDDNRLLNMYFINDDGSKDFLDKAYAEEIKIIKRGLSDALFTNELPVVPKEEQLIQYDTPVAKSWVRDPYIKGSYSNYNYELGEKLDEVVLYKGIKIRKIFAPINSQLFFAGEHATILPEIGTMEAAVESGERIAKLLIDSVQISNFI
jgi:monoamine oxidase